MLDQSTPPVKRRKWQNKANMEKTFQIFNQEIEIDENEEHDENKENKENQENQKIHKNLQNVQNKIYQRKTDETVDSDVENDENDLHHTITKEPESKTLEEDTFVVKNQPFEEDTFIVKSENPQDETFIPQKPSDQTFLPIQPALGETMNRNNIPTLQLPNKHNPSLSPLFPSISREADLRTPSPDFINSTVTEFSFIRGLQTRLQPEMMNSQVLSPRKHPWNQTAPRSSSPIRHLDTASRIRERRRRNNSNTRKNGNNSGPSSKNNSRNNSGNNDITPPIQLSTAEKRDRRLAINKRYSVMPNVRVPRTPKIAYQEKFKFDPDDHETKEKSITFIEKQCTLWLQRVLAPVNWETTDKSQSRSKGKKNLCKYRCIFREFFINECKPSLDLVYKEIDQDKFILRERKDLKDVGKMNKLAKFFVDAIHPIWLVLAIESILHAILPLSALHDAQTIGKILKTQFFIKEGSTLLKNQKTGATKSSEKWYLRRCFELFKFLDMAKTERLIDEDPPLFNPKCKLAGGTKCSLNFLTEWSTKWLGKEGSIQKHLKRLNYELIYTQKTIDEIDVNIEKLSTDLQNGVRVAKLLQTSDVTKWCDQEVDVIQHLRFNPGAKSDIPRMSREYNWKQVLKVCRHIQIDLSFNKNDEPASFEISQLSSGHCEQTLGFVVRLIRHFYEQYQSPSVEILLQMEAFVKLFLLDSPSEKMMALGMLKEAKVNAVIKIQRWYRNQKIIKYEKELVKIVKVQKWWKNKRFQLQIEKRVYLKKKALLEQQELESCLMIQNWWRIVSSKMILAKLKQKKRDLEEKLEQERIINELRLKQQELELKSVLILQRFARCYQAKSVLVELREKSRLEKVALEIKSAVIIQKNFKKFSARKQYLALKSASITIQTNFRRVQAINQLQKLRIEKQVKVENSAAVVIQSFWKGYVQLMKYSKTRQHLITLQSHVRKMLAVRSVEKLRQERREQSAVMIQKMFRMMTEKKKYEKMRKSCVLIQSCYRRHLAEKLLKNLRAERNEKSAVKIQSVFKGYIARKTYLNIRHNLVTVQSTVRRFLAIKKLKILKIKHAELMRRLEELRRGKAALKIQSIWKGYVVRKSYLQKKNSAIVIQTNFKRYVSKKEVLNGLKSRKASIVIQKVFRGRSDRKRVQHLIEEMRVAKEVRERKIIEEKSAIFIQKMWRGYSVRKHVDRKVLKRRWSLASLKEENVWSLQECTNFNIQQLKDFKTTKELSSALKGLITAVKLLPEIQSLAVIQGSGLDAIFDFITQSTQTPDHIGITTCGLELSGMVFDYISPNQSCIENLLLYNVNIMVRDKFAYKMIENTKCLKASLKLHNKANSIKWGNDLFDSEATKVQVKRLKELKGAYSQILNNMTKYKNKPLWIKNCREVSKLLIEAELGNNLINCTY